MISDELKCIQIHIPKTAGVSIRKSLFDKDPDKHMHWYPDHPKYKKKWNKYFTFTFVRNPWDRIVSCYEFCFKRKNHPIYKEISKQYDNFQEFLLEIDKEKLIETQRFQPQMNWVKSRRTGKFFGIDYIGKFETLKESYKEICNHLNIDPLERPLDFLNVTESRNLRSYEDYYKNNSKLINIVKDMYKEDIEYFDYKYGE
jgi:hypothetical protein